LSFGLSLCIAFAFSSRCGGRRTCIFIMHCIPSFPRNPGILLSKPVWPLVYAVFVCNSDQSIWIHYMYVCMNCSKTWLYVQCHCVKLLFCCIALIMHFLYSHHVIVFYFTYAEYFNGFCYTALW
jgi:hypothetical protein